MLSDSSHAIARGPGAWLQHRRIRLAVWIAALEGVVVLFSHDLTKWMVVALAVVGSIAWIAGRESRSSLVRQVLWIFAASQLLAVILVVLAWIVKLALILGIVAVAAIGLGYLFLDRR